MTPHMESLPSARDRTELTGAVWTAARIITAVFAAAALFAATAIIRSESYARVAAALVVLRAAANNNFLAA